MVLNCVNSILISVISKSSLPFDSIYNCFFLHLVYTSFAALLLKLEKRIADVQIDSSELGFTKPGPYIYELLGDLNVTSKTANKLMGIIEEAVLILEEGELTCFTFTPY